MIPTGWRIAGPRLTTRRRAVLGGLAAWCALAAAAGLSALGQSPAPLPTEAQATPAERPDRVQLAPTSRPSSKSSRWYPRAVTEVTGRVTAFDAEQISVVHPGADVPTRYAAERVLNLQPSRLPADQARALAEFRQGQHGAALRTLVRSVSDPETGTRPPVWRQQWLSMLAAQAAMRAGRGEIALELVAQLDRRGLPPLITSLLPIDWKGIAKEPLIAAAVEGAGDESVAVKLVAASWLLQSPKYHSAAVSASEQLTRLPDRPHLAALAAQLRWASKPPPQIQAELRRWERELDALPMVLQTGPMIAIQTATAEMGLDQAAKKWNLALQHAAPTWHPDLPSQTAEGDEQP